MISESTSRLAPLRVLNLGRPAASKFSLLFGTDWLGDALRLSCFSFSFHHSFHSFHSFQLLLSFAACFGADVEPFLGNRLLTEAETGPYRKLQVIALLTASDVIMNLPLPLFMKHSRTFCDNISGRHG